MLDLIANDEVRKKAAAVLEMMPELTVMVMDYGRTVAICHRGMRARLFLQEQFYDTDDEGSLSKWHGEFICGRSAEEICALFLPRPGECP